MFRASKKRKSDEIEIYDELREAEIKTDLLAKKDAREYSPASQFYYWDSPKAEQLFLPKMANQSWTVCSVDVMFYLLLAQMMTFYHQ